MQPSQYDVATDLAYQAISNDRPVYDLIVSKVRNPDELRVFTVMHFLSVRCKGAWYDLLNDLMSLIDWTRLFNALKDIEG